MEGTVTTVPNFIDGQLPSPAAIDAGRFNFTRPGELLASFLRSAERGFDFLAVIAGVYIADVLYQVLGLGKRAQYSRESVVFCAAGFALLFIFLLERHGGYRPCISLLAIRETERILRVTLQAFCLALAAVYLCAASVSRYAFSLAVLAVPAFVVIEKYETHNLMRWLRSKGCGTRRAVILGAGPAARRIYSALVRSPKFGIEPVAFVDHGQTSAAEIYESSYTRQRSARVLSDPLCPELFRQLDASVLVIAAPEMDRNSLSDIIAKASQAGVSAYFVPGDYLEPGYWLEYSELDGIMLAHLSKEKRRTLCDIGKRLLDVAVSLTFLAGLSPFLLFIAMLVRSTSPGPALFRQVRVGKAGRRFNMYKFRTMFREVPKYGYSPRGGEDPRVTAVGRFLRRTSLDELPQLINVFFGQMSLVGPRPEMPFIVEQYTALQRQRLAVKPGLTGLWQLSADRAFLIHENMEYDLYYVRNRSLFMDVAIMLHTLLYGARGV